MQIHQGSFGPSTTESNSLVANLLKYPEISPIVTDIFPQYSLAHFTENAGRYASQKFVGDRIVKWPLQGRKIRASIVDAAFVGGATDGIGFAPFTVDFDPNEFYLNPNDVVKFPGGITATVILISGSTVTFKIQTTDATVSLNLTAAAGMSLGVIDSSFEEGSERSYGNQAFPDWHQNALGITRQQLDMTGSALTDVLWVQYGSQKLWFFEAEKQFYDGIEYKKELASWYTNSTVNAAGQSVMQNASGKFLYKGDGLIAQVAANNIDTYSGTITEQQITNFLAMLMFNVGGGSNTVYTVWGGTGACLAFDRAMKDYFIQPGALVWNATTGQNITLGGTFKTYRTFAGTIQLVHSPVFDDPVIHGNEMVTNSFGTYPKESYRMFFCNTSMMGNTSNLELAVKSAGGINRGRIIKYLPGMVNPFEPNGMMAVTPNDKFSVEYLAEWSYILHNPYSCGMLLHA